MIPLKNVLCYDEDRADFLAGIVTDIFPGASVHPAFMTSEAEHDVATYAPELWILDSFGGGADRFETLVDLVRTTHPTARPKAVVFVSAVDLYADECRSGALGLHFIPAKNIVAADTFELQQIRGLAQVRHGLKRNHTDRIAQGEIRALPALFNRLWDLGLPQTPKTVGRFLIDHRVAFAPPEAALLVEKDYISARQALALMSIKPPSLADAEIDSYTWRANNKDSVRFCLCGGPAVVGPVAFSLEDAKRLHAKGHKPVLIVEDFAPALYDRLKGLGGIVLTNPTFACGHTRIVAEAQGVGYLEQPQDPALFNAWQSKLRAGQAVTLIPRFGEGQLVRGKIDIDQDYAERDLRHTLVLTKQSPASIWKTIPPFRATIDSLDAFAELEAVQLEQEDRPDGIGLVRTERHAALHANNLKEVQALLQGDLAALPAFGESQRLRFISLFASAAQAFAHRRARGKTPINVRLLDAPPSEFLTPDQFALFGQKTPPEARRGVQLARAREGLYETQLAALFAAAARFTTSHDVHRALDFTVTVPNGQTADEVLWVRHLAEARAGKTPYRLGAMIETVSALDAIDAFAKVADSLSLGTNDLIEGLLGVSRNDAAARHAYRDDSGFAGDPFTRLPPRIIERLLAAIASARQANPSIRIGLCGAQATDLDTLVALQPAKLDWVSVPPSRRNLVALPLDLLLRTFKL
jgi:hypothetical protein